MEWNGMEWMEHIFIHTYIHRHTKNIRIKMCVAICRSWWRCRARCGAIRFPRLRLCRCERALPIAPRGQRDETRRDETRRDETRRGKTRQNETSDPDPDPDPDPNPHPFFPCPPAAGSRVCARAPRVWLCASPTIIPSGITLNDLLKLTTQFKGYEAHLYGPQEDELGEAVSPLLFAALCKQRREKCETTATKAGDMAFPEVRDITLRCIVLHCIALQYVALHYIAGEMAFPEVREVRGRVEGGGVRPLLLSVVSQRRRRRARARLASARDAM